VAEADKAIVMNRVTSGGVGTNRQVQLDGCISVDQHESELKIRRVEVGAWSYDQDTASSTADGAVAIRV
jgi:peptide deformylase